MSQINKAKQVTECNAPAVPAVVHTYSYSQYENEVTGLISKPMLITGSHEVLAANDRLIVLNNDNFTSLTIDGTNYAGKNGLDIPALYAYIDDPYYGNGIIFSLSSSTALSSSELADIIGNEIRKKTRGLSCLVDIEFTIGAEISKLINEEAA